LIVLQNNIPIFTSPFVVTEDEYQRFTVDVYDTPLCDGIVNVCVNAPVLGSTWDLRLSGCGFSEEHSGGQGYFCFGEAPPAPTPSPTPPWDIGITTTGSSQTFSIQLDGTGPNITVDWGDGTVQPFTTTGTKTRTYASAGNYTVKISGSFSANGRIILGTTTAEKSRVQSTSVIPTIPGLTRAEGMFAGCTALTTIPAGLFVNNSAIDKFSNCFNGCASLTPIPAGLFSTNTAVTDFNNCFNGCTSLTTIPAGLFTYNSAVNNFSSCFNGCTALASIPVGLFSANIAAIDFNNCFSNCTALVSIPAGLFDNNTAVNNFASCFSNCTALVTIPVSLFANNAAAVDQNNCFSGCTSLVSVPANLFANNVAVNNFASCFNGCTSLTTVPASLFADATAVTDFNSCFVGVTLTTTSYSNLLINMASNAASRQNNVPFNGGNSKYNASGQTARNTLAAKGWVFIDGGLA
jgi:hypothetical protein